MGIGSNPTVILPSLSRYEAIALYLHKCEYSWVVKVKNTSGHNTPIGHHTDCGPMGLGQYNSLEEYCNPHTASSVFLMLILPPMIRVSPIDYNYLKLTSC